MLKPIDQSLKISDIQLVKKKGGKSDFVESFTRPLKVGVLVVSTSTFQGRRQDKSGKIIQEFLKDYPVKIVAHQIVPDNQTRIKNILREWTDKKGLDLIFTTGGTGLSPNDVTPEATRTIIEREVPGIAETIRHHGQERTPYAMLSREVVGVRGKSLIINLPGSSQGARESLESLFPGVLHAFPMLWGRGHKNSTTPTENNHNTKI